MSATLPDVCILAFKGSYYLCNSNSSIDTALCLRSRNKNVPATINSAAISLALSHVWIARFSTELLNAWLSAQASTEHRYRMSTAYSAYRHAGLTAVSMVRRITINTRKRASRKRKPREFANKTQRSFVHFARRGNLYHDLNVCCSTH